MNYQKKVTAISTKGLTKYFINRPSVLIGAKCFSSVYFSSIWFSVYTS